MIQEAFAYALQAVTLPLGRILWLYGEPLTGKGDIYQPSYSEAEQLRIQGYGVFSDWREIKPGYAAVVARMPRQREEAEGLMALAMQHARGLVLAIASNDAGGRRLKPMMQQYGVDAENASKSRCQIVWTVQAGRADKNMIAQNISHLAPRPLMFEGKEFLSVPGLFSWDRVDPGSALLLESLPVDLSGDVADFGCGYGYLSAALQERFKGARTLDAYDNDARAVECCARNAPGANALWRDVTTLDVIHRYDAVIMNPPFHSGKAQDNALGQKFIEKAMQSLKPGGRLFMVANRHLPYEKVVPGLRTLREEQGYKIMTGRA